MARSKELPFPVPVIPPKNTARTAAVVARRFSARLYRDFFNFPIRRAQSVLEKTPAAIWEQEGQKRALQIFHAAAERVPAYKDFLKKHKIKHKKIKTIGDLKNVPPVDKGNYLRRYPLKDLSWGGMLHTSQIISVSSGSTGNPFFWPRGLMTELETTQIFELILAEFFHADRVSTLFVNAFAMGMYVGGPITLNAVLRVAQKGQRITIVTPGYSLEDIHRVVTELGPQHKQVVLGSYPPFAKDIIDDGVEQGIDWRGLGIKFLLAGEGFSESWRDYMAEMTGANSVCDFVSLYGTADAAVLGHETPTSIIVRKAFDRDRDTRSNIFGDERLPSLLQFYPSLRFFEVVKGGELVFTASAGIPLVRYNIHDRGGIIGYEEGLEMYADLGESLNSQLRANNVSGLPWRLPFVYIFGRSDFTTVFYGANIYPESIKVALEKEELRQRVTGKFTMYTEDDRQHNQQLIVNVECKRGTRATYRFRRSVEKMIVHTLLDLNSEYGVVYKSRGKKAKPKVRLCRYGDNEYFNRGVKQSWTTGSR